MTAFPAGLTLCNDIHGVDDTPKIIAKVKSEYPFISYTKSRGVWNIPIAFDIETSSFFQQLENGETQKTAIMYVWTVSIAGNIIMGRTWPEYLLFIEHLKNGFDLSYNKRAIIYVHNLSYDFSFFRKWFEWVNVFSLDHRKPVYAVSSDGIEYRCSYILSGYSLAKVAENLHYTKIKKLIGDLDYNLLRHSKTELTDEEKQYCINDVQIIVAYIDECIRDNGDINNIPLTKTGFIRRYVRQMCLYSVDEYESAQYYNKIHRLNMSVEEYYQLHRAFQGGFTHANPFYVREKVLNVTSFDFISSYPAVIVAERFPMSSSELLKEITTEDFNFSINNYCCLFEIELFDVSAVVFYDNYISRYRCRELVNPQVNNGRIVKADHLKMTITEQDYFIIKDFYKWSKMRIGNFRRYKRGYLPTPFIKAVLSLYKNKTILRDVPGKEVEYLKSKEMLNSCYGMMVTDPLREDIQYIDNQWDVERGEEPPEKDPEREIKKYNKNKHRFLFYPWGVWVTAYARRNLFTAIREFGPDYVYSDTDSVKVVNAESHMDYIKYYNFTQRMKLLKAMQFHKLAMELTEPSTIKGVKKPLGAWDNDGTYKAFKTLGAKRYMVEYPNGKVNITVSGLNKKITTPYIIERSNNHPFEFFNDNMTIPGEYTGKQTHTYIDRPRYGVITDYKGVVSKFVERSGVHLCNSPHAMKLAFEFRDYLDYVRGLKNGNKIL